MRRLNIKQINLGYEWRGRITYEIPTLFETRKYQCNFVSDKEILKKEAKEIMEKHLQNLKLL